MSLVSVEKASFAYKKGVCALNNISFTVETGEHIALIGPNGSGKTTLFNLLAGFTRAKTGSITFAGVDIQAYSPPELAKHLALVPQRVYLNFPYTCLETVLMGLHPYHRHIQTESAQALQSAQTLMEQTEVWHLAAQFVTEISGGELQRVLLARALLQVLPQGLASTDPPCHRVLLLDEAFSSLDIAARITMMKLLNTLRAVYGLTIIGIHHDIPIAFGFTQRILALSHGSLVADGKPEVIGTEAFFAQVFSVHVEIIPGKGFLFVDTLTA
ncbi:MAG: ABC transporter ATP-binding protein [Treponema sp.]|jgi:iron complex transport system ATP-binding protein|nr:ABC transporter ATP-binding protein [Treponema sp.]